MKVATQLFAHIAFCALFVVGIAERTKAELNECGGVWTNKTCEAGERTSDDATVDENLAERKEEARVLSKKRSLFHELTMRSIQAKREFAVDYDLDEVEEFCFKGESSLAACKEKIVETRRDLNWQIAQVATVRQQQKANKLREEANRLQQERNEIEANNPTVVVDERRNYYLEPYYGKHRHGVGHTPVRYHRTGPKADSHFKDGSYATRAGHYHRRSAGGAAITISGSGSLGNSTRVGVRGSVGGSSTTSTTTYSTTSR